MSKFYVVHNDKKLSRISYLENANQNNYMLFHTH